MSSTAVRKQYDIAKMPPYFGIRENGTLAVGPASRIIESKMIAYRCHKKPEGVIGMTRYGQIEGKLRSLLKAPEFDDFGPVRPSVYAFALSRKLLFGLAVVGDLIPVPEDMSTDHDGFLRISWRNADKFLELVIPRDGTERPYLYRSNGPEYGIDPDASSDALKERLHWLRR